MLFPEFRRTDFDMKSGRTSNYAYWNNSARPLCELMRMEANHWGESWLSDQEFVNRFSSEKDEHHDAAVFELMLYQILRNSGFEVNKHPPMLGTNKTPDFVFSTTVEPNRIFLECTMSADSFEDYGEKKAKGDIEEVISAFLDFPYFINVEYLQVSTRGISQKKLKAKILDLAREFQVISDDDLPEHRFLFRSNGWTLSLSLMRKRENVSGSRGYEMNKAKFIDPVSKLSNALTRKTASRYGISADPYVIAVKVNDGFTKDIDISMALFGMTTESPQSIQQYHTNSLFRCNGLPVNTSTSAVIFFKNFHPFCLQGATSAIWHNPFAKKALTPNILPLDEYVFRIDNNQLHRESVQKESTMFDLLKISESEYNNGLMY